MLAADGKKLETHYPVINRGVYHGQTSLVERAWNVSALPLRKLQEQVIYLL